MLKNEEKSCHPFRVVRRRLPPSQASPVLAAFLLWRKRATEAGFRTQVLARIRAIHISAHGVSSTTFAERAALVLGRGSNDALG
jgi:hypothetical protein